MIEAYFILIVLGAFLLSLPISQAKPVSLVDNFFISASAVCVTGLASVDVGSMYFHFGHWIVILLMQAGFVSRIYPRSSLVISGGFGFIASMELPNLFKKKTKISLHTKLALIFTIFLLTGVAAGFFVMEHSNSLETNSLSHKVLTSFAYSTMSRTAGINFSNISSITSGTLMMTLIAMFIGANPGNCGGGIKTTTFAVVVLLAFNRLCGRNRVHVLGKTIPQDIVNKSVYLFIISVVIIVLSTFILLLTENGNVPYTVVASDGHFLHFAQIVFESISAYTTCGLSLGATSELSVSGKVVVCFMMFVGRMGPLFLISSIVKKNDDQVWGAEENIMIG